MLRAIKEIRPSWIVGENVLGLANWNGGLVFHEVQTDLEAQGYEVQPVVLAAAGVGAPHRRDRIWFVANALSVRLQQCEDSGEMGHRQIEICRTGGKLANGTKANGEVSNVADTNVKGLQGSKIIGGVRSVRKDGNKFSPRRFPSNWANFPTQSPICTGDDGIPNRLDGITFSKWRNESIKAAGNAIVPQVVYQIFKAIEQYEQLNTTT